MNTAPAVVVLLTLIVFNSILIALYYSFWSRKNKCAEDQSVNCLNITCPYTAQALPTQNKGCGNYAYRLNSNGIYECSNEGIVIANGT
jgi:hypothetical protein